MNIQDHLVIAIRATPILNDPLRSEMVRVLHAMNEISYVDVYPTPNVLTSYKCEGPIGECAICQEEMRFGEWITPLPCQETCSHTFHKDCIDPWLQRKRNCPICRSNI